MAHTPHTDYKNRIFGIDLGTTNSCIATVDKTGSAEVLPNLDHELTTPSVVAITKADEVLVGLLAKRMAAVAPESVCSHVKRKMGIFPEAPEARIGLADRTFAPEEISALILRKLVSDALDHLSLPADRPVKAVITVPAYFGAVPKNATRSAAQLAGIELLDLVHEPVAAAISYGFARADAPMNLLVYDLGGGTFDVTVVRVDGRSVRTVATDGERLLGGYDWDESIVTWLKDQFESRFLDLELGLDDPEVRSRLFETAEQAKIALSRLPKTTVSVTHEGQSLSVELTREVFEDLTADKLELTLEKTRHVLAAAQGKGVSEIHRLLLVGGSSKMPAIPRRLKKDIDQLWDVPVALYEPDLAVAKGAAVLASMIARGEQAADLTGRDGQSPEGRLVTMVNSKSIGNVLVEMPSRRAYVHYMIPRNSELPVSVEATFYTIEDDQDGVTVTVVEERGEPSEEVEENTVLHDAFFEFPAPLPADSPIIYRYTLDGSGILHVFLTEPKSGSTWEVQVDRNRRVTDSDLLRLKPVLSRVR